MKKRYADPMAEAERRIEEALRTGAQSVTLQDLGLPALPQGIGRLTSLKTLFLSRNCLTALPECISELTSLETLFLSGNRLSVLPDGLGGLTSLSSLDLAGNPLTAFPEAIVRLRALEDLNLSQTQIAELPEGIGDLTGLVALNMHSGPLGALPQGIGRLACLRVLNVAGNQLTALPETLGRLTRLSDLLLSNNRLKSLPEVIGGLVNLQELYLGKNELTALPHSIQRLRRLRKLYLHGNEQLGIPTEVLGPTPKEVWDDDRTPAPPAQILAYYFRTRGASRPLNEADRSLTIVCPACTAKLKAPETLIGKRVRCPGCRGGFTVQASSARGVDRLLRLPFPAYGGEEPYVFVSYAHKDREAVFAEMARLRDLGCRIWYDEGIQPGNEWPEEIGKALKASAFFLVFLSQNAVDSRNVRNEINRALALGKDFVAVHLEPTALSEGLEVQIGTLQAILRHRLPEAEYHRKLTQALPDSLFG
jgi:hypothetical protein